MRLCRAAFEQHDFDDPQSDDAKDAGKQNPGKKQPSAAGLQRLSRRSLGNHRGAGRRPEMARSARVVVISLERLGCDHHRLLMIWAIKSSSDLARRGGLAGGLGFAAVLTGKALASWGAAEGFSNRAGMARSALCVTGGSAAVCGAAGSGAG